MNLDIATSVRYPDGEAAGTIEKVVFDPAQGTVHEIVMSTPSLLGRMVIVPVALLREESGEVLTIDADREAVDALPDYQVDRYMDPPEGWELSDNYAPGGTIFPATIYFPIVPEIEESNLPEGTVEIGQGTEVLCTDGRYGIVDEVVLDDSNNVVSFIVRPDGEYAPDLEVPMSLVQSTDALAVQLNCTLAELPTLGTPLADDQDEPENEAII